MKPVLVKKALPRHWSKDFDTTEDLRSVLRQARLMSLEDAKNIENIPLRPEIRDWELEQTAEGMKSIVPGIQGGKITDQGYVDEGGAFTYPPQLQSFLPLIHPEARMSGVTMPDIPGSMGKPGGRPSVLVGSFEKPEFHATQKEGRVQTEGFMPGGFDPSQAVLLTEPSRAFARQEVPMAIHNLVGGKMKDYAPGTFGYNEPAGRAMESFNILPHGAESPLSQYSGWGKPRTVDDVFRLSEPMDIAFQLLKAYDVEEVKRKLMDKGSYEDYVDYQIADAQPGMDRTLPRPYGLMSHQALNALHNGWFEGDIRDMLDDPNFSFERDNEGNAIWSAHNLGWGNPEHADPEHMGFMIENQLEGTPVDFEGIGRESNLRTLENVPFELNEPQSSSFLGMKMNPTSTTSFSTHSAHGPTNTLEEVEGMKGRGFQDIYTGEPMDIALQLLKERVSPEAKRHKLEYDKKYESSPERVKYREDLNRERRRRGIYGSHNHQDVSHTEGGKLTLESEHENRARHFKDKGTLREL